MMYHTDLVDVEQGEKLFNFLWSDYVLRRHVPVRTSHLVFHLIHTSCCGSDADAARLVETHRLHREMVQKM